MYYSGVVFVTPPKTEPSFPQRMALTAAIGANRSLLRSNIFDIFRIVEQSRCWRCVHQTCQSSIEDFQTHRERGDTKYRERSDWWPTVEITATRAKNVVVVGAAAARIILVSSHPTHQQTRFALHHHLRKHGLFQFVSTLSKAIDLG